MIAARLRFQWSRFLEHSVLTTDFARGARSAAAFIGVWLVCLGTGHPAAAVFAATAAQNLTLVDVRGDYYVRLAVLGFTSAVMSASVFAGTLTGDNLWSATLMMGALALLGCVWRHLSGDYGPNLAVISALLFLIALGEPGDWRAGALLMSWVLLGCAAGILLQLAGWCFRPQHPLRHAVAQGWVAASDLLAALRSEADPETSATLSAREGDVRATVDAALHALAVATTKKRLLFFNHLDAATQLAARLATRVTALIAGLTPLKAHPEGAQMAPALDLLLQALANAARSAALCLITHRPEQLIALEVRLRQCSHLAGILQARLGGVKGDEVAVAQASRILTQVEELLPVISTTIAETVDHGAAHATWSLRLPDLGRRSLASLSSWLNPAPQLEPVLVRHAWRLAVITMVGTAIYKGFHVPRGYWIAFTAIIVLQPDYGSTRQKAGQRIAGTIAGCVLGSVLIWVKLPLAGIMFFAAITAFYFAYFLKRRYGLAIFFVTLMLVLIMDAVEPVSWQFTASRFLSTLAGGSMALGAAFFLWPQWERDQFPKFIAAGVRANRGYLAAIAAAMMAGEPFAGETIQRKREAERANSLVAASLQRLLGDPAGQRENAGRAAALTAGNQRLTRELTVLAVHLNARETFPDPSFPRAIRSVTDALDTLAEQLEKELSLGLAYELPAELTPPSLTLQSRQVYNQLARIVTVIEAMALTGAGK